MTSETMTKPPTWFWVVSILALLWNLAGVGAYLMDAFMPVEALEAMTQEQRELHESRPPWVTGAYAIAVWGGVLGCIALLLRKKWARPVLLISLIGVIGHQIYMYFLSNTFEVMGSGSMALPMLVLIISVGLVYFARMAHNKGWLS